MLLIIVTHVNHTSASADDLRTALHESPVVVCRFATDLQRLCDLRVHIWPFTVTSTANAPLQVACWLPRLRIDSRLYVYARHYMHTNQILFRGIHGANGVGGGSVLMIHVRMPSAIVCLALIYVCASGMEDAFECAPALRIEV